MHLQLRSTTIRNALTIEKHYHYHGDDEEGQLPGVRVHLHEDGGDDEEDHHRNEGRHQAGLHCNSGKRNSIAKRYQSPIIFFLRDFIFKKKIN